MIERWGAVLFVENPDSNCNAACRCYAKRKDDIPARCAVTFVRLFCVFRSLRRPSVGRLESCEKSWCRQNARPREDREAHSKCGAAEHAVVRLALLIVSPGSRPCEQT